jgi:hypothetical protein
MGNQQSQDNISSSSMNIKNDIGEYFMRLI